jgi:sRNA-binding regulator protein Hfq
MAQDRSANKRARTPDEEALRRRADELHEGGMPFQMAMAVAHGRMDLSEALERMSRKDRVNRLVEEHDLTRALATQIAMGHVELKTILRRRRLQQHRDEHRDRTVLETGNHMTFGLHGKRLLTGTVGGVEAYGFELTPEDGEPEVIHKLQVKFAYDPKDWKRAKKAIRTDRALAKKPRDPIPRPQDRYGCSDKRLFSYVDRGDDITVTLLEGEVIKGQVKWFSRYEMALEVRGDALLYIFRHALHDVSN